MEGPEQLGTTRVAKCRGLRASRPRGPFVVEAHRGEYIARRAQAVGERLDDVCAERTVHRRQHKGARRSVQQHRSTPPATGRGVSASRRVQGVQPRTERLGVDDAIAIHEQVAVGVPTAFCGAVAANWRCFVLPLCTAHCGRPPVRKGLKSLKSVCVLHTKLHTASPAARLHTTDGHRLRGRRAALRRGRTHPRAHHPLHYRVQLACGPLLLRRPTQMRVDLPARQEPDNSRARQPRARGDARGSGGNLRRGSRAPPVQHDRDSRRRLLQDGMHNGPAASLVVGRVLRRTTRAGSGASAD